MSRQYKAHNSILSFIALAFLLYFVGLPLIIAALINYFGSISEVITNVIDLIPFGKAYYWFSLQIINALGGQISAYTGMNGYLSISYILEELAKGLFTAILFESMNYALPAIMGLNEPYGIWNKAKLLLITVANALIAACLSPLPLNYIFSNISSLGIVGTSIISSLLSFILVGGGIAFFVFLNSFNIGTAITYVLTKFIVMSTFRLSVSYLSILIILIGWQNGLFGLMASGVAGLLGVALILGGIELMLDSLFK